MSFRVAVVPEDPTLNGYMLRPLIERVVAEAGRPNARITVIDNPKASGFGRFRNLSGLKAIWPDLTPA